MWTKTVVGNIMTTFKSFEALERQLIKDVIVVTNNAKHKIKEKLDTEVTDYETSNPKYYKHTYELINSPQVTNITGNGKHSSFEVYMDEGISYSTGNYNGAEVISATEIGHSGTIGNHGYFNRTEEAVDEILDSEFRKL